MGDVSSLCASSLFLFLKYAQKFAQHFKKPVFCDSQLQQPNISSSLLLCIDILERQRL